MKDLMVDKYGGGGTFNECRIGILEEEIWSQCGCYMRPFLPFTREQWRADNPGVDDPSLDCAVTTLNDTNNQFECLTSIYMDFSESKFLILYFFEQSTLMQPLGGPLNQGQYICPKLCTTKEHDIVHSESKLSRINGKIQAKLYADELSCDLERYGCIPISGSCEVDCPCTDNTTGCTAGQKDNGQL